MWEYRARPLKIIDGDTVDTYIDAGFRSYRIERLRLNRVNTPERKTTTRAAGDAAMAFTERWLGEAGASEWPIVVRTEKADAFGRYLAECERVSDGANLSDDLLAAGFAVPYAKKTP